MNRWCCARVTTKGQAIRLLATGGAVVGALPCIYRLVGAAHQGHCLAIGASRDADSNAGVDRELLSPEARAAHDARPKFPRVVIGSASIFATRSSSTSTRRRKAAQRCPRVTA